MWLAVRKNVTPSVARSWYTHATAERLRRKVRVFTGFVSRKSLGPNVDLRLEHYLRIQTTLTKLGAKHLELEIRDPHEFVKTIMKCERVHIVTKAENYAAMKSKGNYEEAGIELMRWSELEDNFRMFLWKKMLRGKVANHKIYEPPTHA